MTTRIERLSVQRGGRSLLESVELTIGAGEFWAILGPNGAGKTTLLRAVLGLFAPSAGRVLLDDQDVQSLGARERAARVAWLPQHTTPSEELPALDIVAAARFRFDEPFRVATQKAQQALERVGAGAVAARSILSLSGGERQRVALAALLAQEAPLLLLDEPGNHLDPAQQIEVYRLLGELWRSGNAIACVTHDVNLLRHVGEPARVNIAGISDGKLAFKARFDDAKLPELVAELFGVGIRTLLLDGERVLLAEAKR